MQGKSSVAFAPGGPVNLTLEEAELLSWLKAIVASWQETSYCGMAIICQAVSVKKMQKHWA